MALNIIQKPRYKTYAAGQDIIYVIEEDTNVITTQTNVKFLADIYIANDNSQILSGHIGQFKATPNNAGVGIFDFSAIIENYVSPDYTGCDTTLALGFTSQSKFKTVGFDEAANYHPVHLIDQYCLSTDSIKWLTIRFRIEYTGADGDSNTVQVDPSMNAYINQNLFFNGVLYDTDILDYGTDAWNLNNFGYKLDALGDSSRISYILQTDSAGRGTGNMLSDAPTTQYARITDYGTLPFLNNLTQANNSFEVGKSGTTPNTVNYIRISLYNSAGATLGTFNVDNLQSTGGYSANSPDLPSTTFATPSLIYFGAFPANFTGSGNATWTTHKSNVSYYTVAPFNNEGSPTAMGETYTINIITGDCKYESIRLTWLNKHGTWDYYTFVKKSVRSLATNRTNYTQLGGTWNNRTFRSRGDKGGQKNFRVNTKESIRINTDYVTESEAVWFEQLINSTDVYILNEYFDTPSGVAYAGGNVNRYIEPVVITTSNYTRKTIGNDKLIQYTFDMERANDRRTQSV
jgi:hypothetical protein